MNSTIIFPALSLPLVWPLLLTNSLTSKGKEGQEKDNLTSKLHPGLTRTSIKLKPKIWKEWCSCDAGNAYCGDVITVLRLQDKTMWPRYNSWSWPHTWVQSLRSSALRGFSVALLGSLSMQRFWATDGNRKWTFCRPGQMSPPDFQSNRLY